MAFFFLSDAWIFPQTNKCSFSVILLSNLNLDNVQRTHCVFQLIGAFTGHMQAHFYIKRSGKKSTFQ